VVTSPPPADAGADILVCVPVRAPVCALALALRVLTDAADTPNKLSRASSSSAAAGLL
jgi:hypothetical protein